LIFKTFFVIIKIESTESTEILRQVQETSRKTTNTQEKVVKKVVVLQPFQKKFVILPKNNEFTIVRSYEVSDAELRDIRPFMKYFNELVATELYNDVLFVSERDENVWWYDGERIAFRTSNYSRILNAMLTQPTLTLQDMKDETGISIAAIQKLLDQLLQKKYVERGEKDGSWRVYVTQ